MNKTKTAALAAYILFFLQLTGCGKAPVARKALELPDSVLSVFENIHTRYSDQGRMKVVLSAPKHLRFVSQNEEYPLGFKLVMHDDAGQESSVITANYGLYSARDNRYQAYGSVRVINIKEKQEMETDTLFWDQRKEEIYTHTSVRIKTQDEMITGTGLRAKQDFSQYKITKPTGIFTIKEEKGL